MITGQRSRLKIIRSALYADVKCINVANV